MRIHLSPQPRTIRPQLPQPPHNHRSIRRTRQTPLLHSSPRSPPITLTNFRSMPVPGFPGFPGSRFCRGVPSGRPGTQPNPTPRSQPQLSPTPQKNSLPTELFLSRSRSTHRQSIPKPFLNVYNQERTQNNERPNNTHAQTRPPPRHSRHAHPQNANPRPAPRLRHRALHQAHLAKTSSPSKKARSIPPSSASSSKAGSKPSGK